MQVSTQHDVRTHYDVNALFVMAHREKNAIFAIIGAAVGAAERFIAALIGRCLRARLTQTAFWRRPL